MDRDETVAALRSLSGELDAVVQGLSADQFRLRPGQDEWSLLELCCHLRDAGAIEHERLERIAREDAPTLRTWDHEARARERRYNEQEPGAVCAQLAGVWQRLAGLLEGLPEHAWGRVAHHEEQGVVTLGYRARRQAEHPREHFEQMRTIRARLG